MSAWVTFEITPIEINDAILKDIEATVIPHPQLPFSFCLGP
jgi:hypothetical protein